MEPPRLAPARPRDFVVCEPDEQCSYTTGLHPIFQNSFLLPSISLLVDAPVPAVPVQVFSAPANGFSSAISTQILKKSAEFCC
jgi:hypothetical protein